MTAKRSSEIGARLHLARSKRDITMNALAAKAGISQAAISYIEGNERRPTADIIESLADALEVDPCWLAYGTGVAPAWLTADEKA